MSADGLARMQNRPELLQWVTSCGRCRRIIKAQAQAELRACILRTWNSGATLSQDTKAWPPNCVSSGSPPFSTISWHILHGVQGGVS